MFRLQDRRDLTSSTKSGLHPACSGFLSLSEVSPGRKTTSLPVLLLLPPPRALLTCFISLLSLLMPLLSVLVTPVCPTSWMEMAGLDVEEWMGRTRGETHVVLRNYIASALSNEYVRCVYFYPYFPPRLDDKIFRGGLICPGQCCFQHLELYLLTQPRLNMRSSERMSMNIA